MSGKSIISNSYLEDIGDAIRYKKGSTDTYYPSQMGDAIRSIEGIVPVGSIEIDANGTYNVVEKAEAVVNVQPVLEPLAVSENGTYQPDGFDGYSDVTVDVEPNLTSLSVTENGLYLPESGTDGFDRVTVAVPQPSGSIEITQNGTYNVASKETAVVAVPSEVTFDGLANGSQPSGDITITVEEVVAGAFRDKTAITGVNAPNCLYFRNQAFQGCTGITSINIPKAEVIGDTAFSYNKATKVILPKVKTIGANSFAWASVLKDITIGADIETIGEGLLRNTAAGWVCKFIGAPTSLASRTFYNVSGGDIYVPWSSGEVSGAPWGATGATIHYDTVYDSEWNVISST